MIGYDGRPSEQLGYDCGSERFWWFPKLGFSTAEVFKDESSALDVALKRARHEVERTTALLAELDQHHQGKGR